MCLGGSLGKDSTKLRLAQAAESHGTSTTSLILKQVVPPLSDSIFLL